MTSRPGSDTRETDPGTVTRLLADLESGDRTAIEKLFPIVYDELRALAHRHRRRWSGDTTMGTTALVHEAYLKLTDAGRVEARSSVHFMRIASRAMRHVLSNFARDRRAEKRGGQFRHVPLEQTPGGADVIAARDEQAEALANLADALNQLEAVDKRLSDVVECRFFGGLSIADTAAALGCSPATVKRDWTLARAWLFREMTRSAR